jgi:hypothetical protein
MLDSEEKEPEKPVDPVEERKAREKEGNYFQIHS